MSIALIFRSFPQHMLIVGLTGGVASGKTVVSKVFREEGALIIDLDQVARDMVQPHRPAYDDLIKAFGKGILYEDGSINRKKLASMVFANPNQRERLNQILHPRIKDEIDQRIRAIGQKDPQAIVVIDAPLLIERGEHKEVDQLVVVTSSKKRQIQRLIQRDGISEKEALMRISSQMPLEEKVKWADFVIRNDGSLQETKRRAKEIFKKLKGMIHQTEDRGKTPIKKRSQKRRMTLREDNQR